MQHVDTPMSDPDYVDWAKAASVFWEKFDVFDAHIEQELLARDWTKATRAEAVEMLGYVHTVRAGRRQRYGKGDPRSNIAIPIDMESLILKAAKAGMRKGAGRRGVTKSYIDNWRTEIVLEIARER